VADFFIDHGNTALYPSEYQSVPAGPASLPQDGDGRANGLGAAPASAVASWDLTGASASSGTISLMGATVSALNGGGSTLATNIANAINSSTAAATAADGSIPSVYLRALVWAQASGATLNVYTRFASANLNFANNSACRLVAGSGWTAPPAAANFSGGVSGPWKYFGNETALAASVASSVSGALCTYGAFLHSVMSSPGSEDRVFLRTRRSGQDLSCRHQTSSSSGMASLRAFTLIADDGTIWPEAGVFTYTCATTHSGVNLPFTLLAGTIIGNNHRLKAVFQDIPNNFTGAMLWSYAANTSGLVEEVTYEISSNASLSGAYFVAELTANSAMTYRRCVFKNNRIGGYASERLGIAAYPNGYAMAVFDDCDFVFTGLSSNPSGRLFRLTKANYATHLNVSNCRIYDQNDPGRRFPLVSVTTATLDTVAECEGIFDNVTGITVLPSDLTTGLYGLIPPSDNHPTAHRSNYVLVSAKDAGVYRLENLYGIADWIKGEGYPTLSSLTTDGTPWSVRALWGGQYLGKQGFPLRFSQISLTATGIKTITAELLFSGDIADADITSRNVSMVVTYIDSSGVYRTQRLPYTNDALPAGSNAWAGVFGSYAGFKARKMEVTTSHPVKKDTEVELTISFERSCPASLAGKYVFFDPEFVVS
jgi:hypothetical protein